MMPAAAPLSAADIERQAEGLMDALDARYLNSAMTPAEYADHVAAIDRWTEEAYRAVRPRW